MSAQTETTARAIAAIKKHSTGAILADPDLAALRSAPHDATCPAHVGAAVGCHSDRLRTVIDFVIREQRARRDLWGEIVDASHKFKPIDPPAWLSKVAGQLGDAPPAIIEALGLTGAPSWAAIADKLEKLLAPKKVRA